MNLLRSAQRVFQLLSPKEKRQFLVYLVIQGCVGLLDLFGVLALTMASLNIIGDTSPVLESIVSFIPLLGKIESRVLIILAIASITIKSLLGFTLTKLLFSLTAHISERISTQTFVNLLRKKPSKFTILVSDDLGTILTVGVNEMIIGLLTYSSLAVIEFILLILIIVPVIIFTNVSGAANLIIILSASIIMMKFIGKHTNQASFDLHTNQENRRNIILAASKISNYLALSGKYDFFSKKYSKSGKIETNSLSKMELIQQIPKFSLELMIIVSAFCSLFVLYLTNQTENLVGTGFLFIAAAFRLLPSLVRFQGFYLYAKSKIARSEITMKICEENLVDDDLNQNYGKVYTQTDSTLPSGISIKCSQIAFSYNELESRGGLPSFTHDFLPNSVNLVSGKSGTGKTTLLKIITGALHKSEGTISFISQEASEIRIGYMDQMSSVFIGSLFENIALQTRADTSDIDKVQQIIREVGLQDFLAKNGLFTECIGAPINPSGGESQRIALARIMFSDCNVLVLDEPTSNLDPKSEVEIFKVLKKLSHSKTIILVSHSPLAIEFSDLVVELKGGTINE